MKNQYIKTAVLASILTFSSIFIGVIPLKSKKDLQNNITAQKGANDSTEYEMITFIEEAPVYKGDLAEFVDKNIVYPDSAGISPLKETVVVSFWIDTLGRTCNHEVVRGIRTDLDEEALRVAKLIRFEKPAFQMGKPIRVRYAVPVIFKRE